MVATGTYADHMIVLQENGELYSHGSGYNGQLGLNTTSRYDKPMEIAVLEDKQIVYICADNHVSCFITDKGEVYICGYDDYGQLGQGTEDRRSKKVKGLDGKRIVQVSNSYTCLLLLDDKGVYSCGHNSYGQLRHDGKRTTRKSPQIIEGLKGKKVAKVSAGYYHSDEERPVTPDFF